MGQLPWVVWLVLAAVILYGVHWALRYQIKAATEDAVHEIIDDWYEHYLVGRRTNTMFFLSSA